MVIDLDVDGAEPAQPQACLVGQQRSRVSLCAAAGHDLEQVVA